MPDLGQRIRLIHKLRKLAAAEELFHRRHNRANIDKSIGSGLSRLLDTHALFDDALHTQQANSELRLDQFTHAAYAAISQVINIILAPTAIVQCNETANNIDQVILRQNTLALWYG